MTDKDTKTIKAPVKHTRRGMTPVRLVKAVEDATADAANLDSDSTIADLIDYLEGRIVEEAKNR